MDTHLNWGASYWSNDVYDRLVCQHWLRREPRERELVVVARLSNVLILVIAMIIMANLGSIQTAWFISLLFGAGMGSVLVLRWLWERINMYSELAAMAASLVTAPLLLVYMGTDPEGEWLRLSIMALVTTAAAIGVTYVTPPTHRDVLLAFYERVQPFGFWRETAPLAGDRAEAPVEGLRRRLWAMLVTGLSLFLLLFGVGRLLISPPDANPLWTWVAILAGLALIPLWWRAVLREEDLEVDRSLRPEDVQVTDRALLEARGGLVVALRQLAQHMRVVYGANVEVEARGRHQVEEDGKRVQLFQVVQDLLLFLAQRNPRATAHVSVGREGGNHLVRLAPSAPVSLETPPEWGYDLLEHVRERLYQVEGRLDIEPDPRRVECLTITVPVETTAAAVAARQAAERQAAE